MKNPKNHMTRGFASFTDDGGCQVIDFIAYKTEHPQHHLTHDGGDKGYEVILFMPSNSNGCSGPFDAV